MAKAPDIKVRLYPDQLDEAVRRARKTWAATYIAALSFADGDPSRITVAPDAEALLIQHGWTPPAEDA